MPEYVERGLNNPPPPSSKRARAVMRGNRSESVIERELRAALHGRGYRFRKHYRPLPGLRCSADVAFTRPRIAIFVDGCFWHCCPEHKPPPKANAEWWALKLATNVKRDRRNDAALRKADWHVLRLWTHCTLEEMVAAVDAAFAESRAPERPCTTRTVRAMFAGNIASPGGFAP